MTTPPLRLRGRDFFQFDERDYNEIIADFELTIFVIKAQTSYHRVMHGGTGFNTTPDVESDVVIRMVSMKNRN